MKYENLGNFGHIWGNLDFDLGILHDLKVRTLLSTSIIHSSTSALVFQGLERDSLVSIVNRNFDENSTSNGSTGHNCTIRYL